VGGPRAGRVARAGSLAGLAAVARLLLVLVVVVVVAFVANGWTSSGTFDDSATSEEERGESAAPAEPAPRQTTLSGSTHSACFVLSGCL
jgi:hypothetical protein